MCAWTMCGHMCRGHVCDQVFVFQRLISVCACIVHACMLGGHIFVCMCGLWLGERAYAQCEEFFCVGKAWVQTCVSAVLTDYVCTHESEPHVHVRGFHVSIRIWTMCMYVGVGTDAGVKIMCAWRGLCV